MHPTRSSAAAAALVSGLALALPGATAAASLNPFDGMTGPRTPLDELDAPLAPVETAPPGLSDAIMPAAPDLTGPQPFRIDDGLDPNPLRDVLPESQWANPRAARNGIRRR